MYFSDPKTSPWQQSGMRNCPYGKLPGGNPGTPRVLAVQVHRDLPAAQTGGKLEEGRENWGRLWRKDYGCLRVFYRLFPTLGRRQAPRNGLTCPQQPWQANRLDPAPVCSPFSARVRTFGGRVSNFFVWHCQTLPLGWYRKCVSMQRTAGGSTGFAFPLRETRFLLEDSLRAEPSQGGPAEGSSKAVRTPLLSKGLLAGAPGTYHLRPEICSHWPGLTWSPD